MLLLNNSSKENDATSSIKGKKDKWSDKMIRGILREQRADTLIQGF
jgi:hypothetical protein